jgi:hypothetical protein
VGGPKAHEELFRKVQGPRFKVKKMTGMNFSWFTGEPQAHEQLP